MVHRRLWPALVALAAEIGKRRLTALGEEHTKSGAHRSTRVPFPKWVPKDVAQAAKKIGLEEARAAVAILLAGA